MTVDSSNNNTWRRLYEAAIQVKELAPWDWMFEDEVFGVQDPETGNLGFVSVMGQGGEHFAVGFYLGQEGLYGFLAMESLSAEDDTVAPEMFLQVPQLQASFEDRNELSDKDRQVIKELGLKFRGRQAWPMFRSYRAGFMPWHLDADEARFLTHALEQTLQVAPRIKETPSLLGAQDSDVYLVRVPHREADGLAWEDQWQQVPPPGPKDIAVKIDEGVWKKLLNTPHTKRTIEIDFFMVLTPIMDKERPYFPYALLMVDAKEGFIVGQDLLYVETTVEAMLGKIPWSVASQLATMNMIPQQVKVRSGLLVALLQPLADTLRFKLKESSRLRMLDEVKSIFLELAQ